MRILIAGATGAIGRPVVRRLKEAGHVVFGLARAEKSAKMLSELRAGAVIAEATDATQIRAAIARVRPDAVINELTSLPEHYTAAEMKAAAERDRKVRVEGNANLLAALGEAGVRRYILQSSGFWYAPGAGLADESVLFAVDASPAIATGSSTYAELEAAGSQKPGVDAVALRYGFFYGPGTWYCREGDMAEQLRRQQVAVIGDGQGVWSWVHIEDAAAATVAALECPPGAYNIVDSDPSPQHVWLPAFARSIGAPKPPHVAEKQALNTFGEDTVYYATRLRGASNEKARRELQFRPRRLEWL